MNGKDEKSKISEAERNKKGNFTDMKLKSAYHRST